MSAPIIIGKWSDAEKVSHNVLRPFTSFKNPQPLNLRIFNNTAPSRSIKVPRFPRSSLKYQTHLYAIPILTETSLTLGRTTPLHHPQPRQHPQLEINCLACRPHNASYTENVLGAYQDHRWRQDGGRGGYHALP